MSDIIINTPDRKWLAIAAATSAIEAAAVPSRLGHEDIECLPAGAACNFSSLSRDLEHELEYWA